MKFYSTGSLLVVESGSATWATLAGWIGEAVAGMFSGHDTDAVRISKELLRTWLSPSQLREFDKDNEFTVIGGLTGQAYLICHEMAYNVHPKGIDAKMCFTPAACYPDITIYDRMLAQKIALEQNEEEALRVCNHMPPKLPSVRECREIETPYG